MDIIPASDVLIVKEINPDTMTPGGLHVPATASDKDSITKGEILRAGPGITTPSGNLIPHDYKVGDIIVFDKFKSLPVRYNSSYYIFVNSTNVLGKVEKELN